MPDWVTNLAGAGDTVLRGVQRAADHIAEIDKQFEVRATVASALDQAGKLLQDAFADEEALAAVQAAEQERKAQLHAKEEALRFAAAQPHCDVVLECVQALDVGASLLPVWQKCVARRVKDPWDIGVDHQCQFFETMLPERRNRQFITGTHFRLTWSAPHLMLRKLCTTPVCIEGDAAQEGQDMVVVPNALIDIYGDEPGADPLLVLRVLIGDFASVMSQLQATSSLLVRIPQTNSQ